MDRELEELHHVVHAPARVGLRLGRVQRVQQDRSGEAQHARLQRQQPKTPKGRVHRRRRRTRREGVGRSASQLSFNALRGRRRAACSYATGADVPCRILRPTPPCCTNYTGGWDGSNAERFLRAAATRGDPIAALAYGNELGGHLAISARLPAAAYAEGLSQLEAIVESAWRGATRPAPLLLGPNAQLDEGWLADLLRAAPSLRVLTYHLYPLGA
jgi:hypothetical protein